MFQRIATGRYSSRSSTEQNRARARAATVSAAALFRSLRRCSYCWMLRTGTPEMMCEIARLLRIVGEHIIQQEMIHLRRPRWVDTASECIDRNFHRRITLKELAARTGCSTRYLSHHFPAEFGLPLRAYLRRLRLEKARLLVERGLTLKEIAAETGFYDEFHLSKAFKQFFGVPPSQLP